MVDYDKSQIEFNINFMNTTKTISLDLESIIKSLYSNNSNSCNDYIINEIKDKAISAFEKNRFDGLLNNNFYLYYMNSPLSSSTIKTFIENS